MAGERVVVPTRKVRLSDGTTWTAVCPFCSSENKITDSREGSCVCRHFAKVDRDGENIHTGEGGFMVFRLLE